MNTRLSWLAPADTSALHAAAAVSSGRDVMEPELLTELRPLVQCADNFVSGFAIEPCSFWELACAVSLLGQGPREIAQLIRRKMFGSTAIVSDDHLMEVVRPVLRWGQSAFPELAATMQLRQTPLQAQWTARGPGLLRFIAQLTTSDLLPPSASVALVHPIVGGDGAAHLDFNSIRFEAVLANPLPQLPEVARMGWLVAQLQIDLPVHSDSLNNKRLPWIAALAMLPPTLAAAQLVELVHVDRELFHTAVTSWVLPAFSQQSMTAGAVVDPVWDWWATYQQHRPTWSIALAALDRMMPM